MNKQDNAARPMTSAELDAVSGGSLKDIGNALRTVVKVAGAVKRTLDTMNGKPQA